MNPIRPDQVVQRAQELMPDVVIQIFNDLIAKNFANGRSVVTQDSAVAEIGERMGITRNEVFSRKYLEVEGIFRKAGWRVSYDKPSFHESYPATFTFYEK